jgi:hypothetical protein
MKRKVGFSIRRDRFCWFGVQVVDISQPLADWGYLHSETEFSLHHIPFVLTDNPGKRGYGGLRNVLLLPQGL